MIFTVFTGDLVNSTEMSKDDLDAVMAAMDSLTRNLTSQTPSANTRFARRGGDGWQIACPADVNALTLALTVQANVRATLDNAQTRIAVASGAGTVDGNLNSAHGPAFTASGQLLDRLDGRRLMAHAAGGALDAAFCLADHIAQDWTQAQARAMALKLLPGQLANRVIGDRIGISRQAVDQALAGAGYAALHDALTVLDKVDHIP